MYPVNSARKLLALALLASSGLAVDAHAAGPAPTATTAPAPLFTCRMALTGVTTAFSLPFVENNPQTANLAVDLICPAGVTALNVTQVTWDPYEGIASKNVAHGMVSMALGSSKSSLGIKQPFLILGTGTGLTGVPSQPVRLDINTAETLIYRHACGSGNPSFIPICGGMLFFTGTK